MTIRIISTLIMLLTTVVCLAQETGSVAGKLTDKDYNNEPLPFANIVIKGTTLGTTSDVDGLYELTDLETGSYTLVYSFVGYETQEVVIKVVAGKVTTVNVSMGPSAASLDEVVITTTTRKESEAALLLDQKKAVEIKESIGSIELAKLGVANASAATTKISGVSKSDGAGQIYVRGLGDRYLSTTLNGLPVPSDNIDKKNVDLELFPTRFIENVSISKTFSPQFSADQASGNINISSKDVISRKDFGFSLSSGVNSNVDFNDFKVTAAHNNVTLGTFSRPYENSNLVNALTDQSWDTKNISTPLNYSFGFNAGGFVDEEGKFRIYFSGGQSVDNEYREGLFNEYDQGQLNNIIPDGDNRFWRRTVNTSGMLGGQYKINDQNKLSFNAFAINKVFEEVYEAGRGGDAIIFEELTPQSAGNQFIRDQNIKNTLLTISQLLGTHNLTETNTLNWAIGYSKLAADEPNRIRNEINIMNANTSQGIQDGELQLGNTGGFQQRKTSQQILDDEFSGRINDDLVLKQNEDGDAIYKLNFGGDARYKKRDFKSTFIGLEEASFNTVNPSSIDNLSEIFTQQNVDNGLLDINIQPDDFYDGELTSYAGFIDFIGTFGNFTTEIGLRFQSDNIDINFDVGNYVNPETGQSRIGTSNLSYNRVYPAINLKYALNDKAALRLASSISQTLPEFKEIAPFQYISPLNQVTRGNALLEASRNFNLDLKFEFFPSNDELLSLTAYYKNIKDPINKGLALGGEGLFSYFNTSDNARIFGLELEGKVYIIPKREDMANLKLAGNISYIDHKQDLRSDGLNLNGSSRTFQYRGIDEIGLEGASDWTTNMNFTFSTPGELPYQFTLAGNYSSDRIFSLGSPRNQQQPDTFFNGEIIEKGVVALDFIVRKDINKHLSLAFSSKNLLNPTIERFQLVPTDLGQSSAFEEQTILTYTKGIDANLSINYKF